ncbi:ABC transporter permease [Spiroplasma alleghenense]|uniref:Uncharacterized protein n=1 Tax=Spiroplasma alleghenense TaxID=216931 RepID=A0A345Z4L8_9MOLU|nr:ABC transporter permease [Spiroplasma alleghenense]AXK51547.1 hypothetical protein SALLE_v1c08770 [Spiroplasma alleghenense]
MKQNTKVIFKFSFLRIIKNKFFITFSAICISLIILIPVLAISLGENIIFDVEVAMIFIIILSIFWLSFTNINNIVTIAITDEKSGIQSLENRRGAKNSAIFFSKFGPLKIITISFILLVYLIFTLVTLILPVPLGGFIIRNLAVGVFSLIAYDFLIFGVVLWLSSLTKSLKKTLPAGWILMTLFMFFSIFGPIFFAFNPNLGEQAGNVYDTSIDNKFKLQKTQTNEINFLTQLSESFFELRDSFNDNIVQELDFENRPKFFASDIISPIINYGMITFFGELIEQNSFEKSVESYFLKFNTSLEKCNITINEAELKEVLKYNLYYHFVKSLNIKAVGNKEEHFKNSFFYKSSPKNYNGPQQLKEVLDNFKSFEYKGAKISDEEIEVLKLAIIDTYKFEYTTHPYIFSQTMYIGYEKNNSGDFLENYNFWINSSLYSPGSYLFNMLNAEMMHYLNYPIKVGEEKFQWKSNATINYQINPFMWFYEMVYFSGSNNAKVDSVITENSPLPISIFTFYDLDKNEELIYSNRPFAVWANYLGFITFGTVLSALGYRLFCKTKDERKLVD